jgi:regulator of RNase E activity RraB
MDFKDTDSQLGGIREIFDTARREDNWNPDEEMLYSFYFIDRDVDKLEEIGNELERQGYDFIDIFELGEEGSDEPSGDYLLHIDKIETHTPESLAARNVEFQRLADEREVSYDGWEFGEIGDEEEDEEEEEKM